MTKPTNKGPESWPKLYLTKANGKKTWTVDAREMVKGQKYGRRYFFQDRHDAAKLQLELRDERHTDGLNVHGQNPAALTRLEYSEALQALNLLRPLNCGLLQAATIAKADLSGRKRPSKMPTLDDVWADYSETKEREVERKELEARTLAGYTSIYGRVIAPTLGQRKVDDIGSGDVSRWIDGIPASPRRRKNCKAVLSQLMTYALMKEWRTAANPCEVVTVRVKAHEVETLAPERVARLLEECRRHPRHDLLVPYFAAACLAGLRQEETRQLDWSDVHLGEKQIKVWADTSKKKVCRYVDLIPECVAMLKPYAKTSGIITGDVPGFWRRAWDEARGAAGYALTKAGTKGERWPADCLRHTFASFWLQRHQDKVRLAGLMGNNVAVIDRHYRRAIPAREAAAFWKAVAPAGKPRLK